MGLRIGTKTVNFPLKTVTNVFLSNSIAKSLGVEAQNWLKIKQLLCNCSGSDCPYA